MKLLVGIFLICDFCFNAICQIERFYCRIFVLVDSDYLLRIDSLNSLLKSCSVSMSGGVDVDDIWKEVAEGFVRLVVLYLLRDFVVRVSSLCS